MRQSKAATFVLFGAVVVAALIYSLTLKELFLSDAVNQDEIWFWNLILQFKEKLNSQGFLSYVFQQKNALGYGSLYWILGVLSQSLTAFRGLLLVSVLSLVPCHFLIMKKMKVGVNLSFLSLLLWFSFPSTWVVNKMMGPEYLSLAIGAWGGLCLLSQRRSVFLFGFFLLGAAVGVKPHTLVLLVFFVSYLFFEKWSREVFSFDFSFFNLKQPISFISLLLMGFIFSNPIAVIDPRAFFKAISSVSVHDSSNYHLWNLFYNYGLFNISFSFAALILLCALFLVFKVKNYPLLLAIIFSISVNLLLILINSRFLFWYWLPTVFLLTYVFALFYKASFEFNIFALSVVLINILSFVPHIKSEINYVRASIHAHTKKNEILSCYTKNSKEFLELYPSATVVNFSEFFFEWEKLENLSNPWQMDPYFEYKLPEIYRKTTYPAFAAEAFITQMDRRKPFIVFIGQRFFNFFPFYKDQILENLSFSKNSQFSIDHCFGVYIFSSFPVKD